MFIPSCLTRVIVGCLTGIQDRVLSANESTQTRTMDSGVTAHLH